MPSRSSFHSSQSKQSHIYTTIPGNVSTEFGPGPSTVTWTDSVTYGDNIPDWQQKLRNGENATTTMNGSRKECRVKSGAMVFRLKTPNPPHYITVRGHMKLYHGIPGGNPSTIGTANADNLALAKFAQKLNLINTAIQGGVVIGELRQTLQTVRNPALGLRRLVDDGLLNLRSIRAARRLGTLRAHTKMITQHLADAWLELQFGWKPLLSDIRSGLQALDHYNAGQRASVRRITATEQTVQVTLDQLGTGTASSFASWRTRQTETHNCQVVYRGAVRVEAQHPGSMSDELLGFNPGSFAPTIWELIPYSFLIDYFSNIGGIIYGMSNLGTRLAWCNRTVRQQILLEQSAEELKHPDVTVTGIGAKVVSSNTLVSRAKYTGIGIPALAFKIPGFRSLKWLNIAALIASRKADRNWSFD